MKQIVIEIEDRVYERIKYLEPKADNMLDVLMRAIMNGTPLPKGHGRLIDADALETEMVNDIRAGNYEEGYETFAHINNMDDCVDCVRCADTIIEADKEANDG